MNNTLSQQVATELRAEMARQNRTVRDLAEFLQVGYKAAKRRHTGGQELSLDEVSLLSEWLQIPIEQLTSPKKLKLVA